MRIALGELSMIKDKIETALVAVLARLSDSAEDSQAADRAIDLFLNRFGDDQVARMLAIRRMTTELLRDENWDEDERPERRSVARS